MERLEEWFVCLDLTSMDDILIGYADFLTSEIKPKKITFIHVIKSTEVADDMVQLFPELENREDFDKVIRKDLQQKIDNYFSESKAETELLIEEGRPTDVIVEKMNSINPDMTIMGKKAGYTGKGVIPRKIMKYVYSSILFVPEAARYQLTKVLVPTDFSDQSAKAIHLAYEMTRDDGGNVIAQNVYNYPAQFFPYLPQEDDEKKMNEYLKNKKEEFIEKHSIPKDVEFEFSLNVEGSKMDQIYDLVIQEQIDMIVGVSKADKGITSVFREDFTDKMAYFRFGVPLLIKKDKQKHQKFLKKLFGS
ncbi:universal stress protein [Rhodohalobacter sp. 8-1]|uniref:universal stress protein n=1 Tax=Rhodohalobacter sp. 8-1 TaxID=3131972 RepID=UPI0030EC2E46